MPSVGTNVGTKNSVFVKLLILMIFLTKNGGGPGIRTPGTFRFNGFQDRRIRPLCHFSKKERRKYNAFLIFTEFNLLFYMYVSEYQRYIVIINMM